MEWGELAAHLQVSRSMVDQARKQTRQFGPKVMRRLIDVEREAGLEPTEPPLEVRESPVARIEKPHGAQGLQKKLKIAEIEHTIASMERTLEDLRETVRRLKEDAP
jgi:hypothetical protein